MVEAGRSRWAGAREAAKKTTMKMKEKEMKEKTKSSSISKKEKEKESGHYCTVAAESPSYRLALKSLFSCRSSSAPAPDRDKTKKLQGRCSGSASICKLRDNPSPYPRVMQRPPPAEEGAEPCKRRASVSACNSSSSERERERKKPLSEAAKQLSSSSSFRAGVQLRRLSGCYECHMVVDPINGGGSMRATIYPCPAPDCGEIFVRPESLHLHQSTRHAVCELGGEDTSRNIIEIIFQSSWLKKQSPVCSVHRILKVHNTPATLARFEDYRDAVKSKARAAAKKHYYPRCTADGNELLRFRCAALACQLGLHGATHLCDSDSSGCHACAIIRDGFPAGAGIRTMATSGRAHDAVPVEDDGAGGECRAMLVCRVIAGRVRRPREETTAEEEYESVAGSAGVYSNLDELEVFHPAAILPCFVVVYKAS